MAHRNFLYALLDEMIDLSARVTLGETKREPKFGGFGEEL